MLGSVTQQSPGNGSVLGNFCRQQIARRRKRGYIGGMGKNRIRAIGIAVIVAAVLASGQTDTSSVADSSKTVRIPVERGKVNVPRPKTNWSKLKELFM